METKRGAGQYCQRRGWRIHDIYVDIVERVRAGLRHTRAKGKRLGRPKKVVDAAEVTFLWAAGNSWRAIWRKMGVSVETVFAIAQENLESNSASISSVGGD